MEFVYLEALQENERWRRASRVNAIFSTVFATDSKFLKVLNRSCSFIVNADVLSAECALLMALAEQSDFGLRF